MPSNVYVHEIELQKSEKQKGRDENGLKSMSFPFFCS